MVPAGLAFVIIFGLILMYASAAHGARRRPYDWERDGL